MPSFSWQNFFHVDYRKCMSNNLMYLVYNWHCLTSSAKSVFLTSSHLSESNFPVLLTKNSNSNNNNKRGLSINPAVAPFLAKQWVSRVCHTCVDPHSRPLSFPLTSAWRSVSSSLARALDIFPTCFQPTSIFCHCCQFFSLYSTSL